ncbi:MAG: twin-arginine translocase subunit TatC [Solirubrobacterales bacterium]
MARLKTARAQFDDRLTLVDHLDELRNRIILALVALGVAFALCFWQNSLLLDIANDPLPADTPVPITFGVTEPFFTTVEVSAYGAMILALPVVLYQLYAFVLPAFSLRERRTITPFLIAMPILFIAGVAFAYFVVMPVAVKFLLNFNDAEFDINVRARDYYSFFGLMLVAMGLLFQIPIAMLSVTRLGIVAPEWFAHNRRYAIFIIAVVSAAAPGGDPVSMIMIMIPLLLLYEGSIAIAKRFGRPHEEPLGTEVSPGEAG